jgi:hypothetical protein
LLDWGFVEGTFAVGKGYRLAFVELEGMLFALSGMWSGRIAKATKAVHLLPFGEELQLRSKVLKLPKVGTQSAV